MILLTIGHFAIVGSAAEMPAGNEYINSIGMKFVRIEPGTFKMGQLKTPLPFEIMPVTGGRGDRLDALVDGDFDERPIHEVQITRPLYVGIFEVTNTQYELFDPDHKKLRGKEGLSTEDDEAVINVSWYDAQAFCRWLSNKERLPYRLPTEAEWEYACRAGTTTHYYTGDMLPKQFYKNARENKGPVKARLHVGETAFNAWGLYDIHGNVEEWCMDWYGPYKAGRQVDPVGYADGEFRVLRSGSHSASIYELRSANRLGALPEDKHWLIGFRVVLAPAPQTSPLPVPKPPLHQQNVVRRDPTEISKGPDPSKPYFAGPKNFVKIPRGSQGPLFASHNHDPAIVECPNGDLLACWYTCVSERNRELGQAASRLRWGADEWEPASLFWDAPGRNDHAPALWYDGKNKIYHFTGMSFAGEHRSMVTVMRTSSDNGATWSRARIIVPEYRRSHMPSEPVFRLHDDTIVFSVDGPNTLWMSPDEAVTWFNPGGDIPGIHTGVTQLSDGRIIAFNRGKETKGMMTQSISHDLGKTFEYSASPFPGVEGGQRLVLLHLKEGPLFFAAFADKGTIITDSEGNEREVQGLYTAVSLDNGKTWPHKRLVTDDGPGRPVETTNGGQFLMSGTYGENRGYLSVCQSLDNLIHLISSKQHYTFNLKWLMTPAPPLSYPPVRVKPVTETFTGPDFDAEGWKDYKDYEGGFNGKGQYTIKSPSRSNGINRIIGEGSFEANVSLKNLSYHPPARRTTPGPAIVLRDARARSFSLRIERDHISMEIGGGDPARKAALRKAAVKNVTYDQPPTSAKVRLIYNERTRQCKVYYGLNGAEPTKELPRSKAGLYYGKPLSETTGLFLLIDQASADIDHVEIKPINP